VTEPAWDLLIVGGGPAGLLAGLVAEARGLRFRVLERESSPRPRSRSIGIHPPALQLLADLGVATPFLEAGSRIQSGHALAGPEHRLGTLDFRTLPAPWNFILTLPQWRTEALLEEALSRRAPESLLRSRWVRRVEEGEGGLRVIVTPLDAKGSTDEVWTCRYLLACDGKRSELRQAAGIEWQGAPYPHHFVMGDFPSGPEREEEAFIYLHPRGLVESFPLGSSLRRWVVERGPRGEAVDPATELVREVALRCGRSLDLTAVRDLSTFGVERFEARRMWKGRIVLAGDAAHVVSPIGGQGMNLAWLNAQDAVATLQQACAGEQDWDELAPLLAARMRKRARTVAKRAEQNLWLATRGPLRSVRTGLVWGLLRSPLRRGLAQRFSMHNV